MRRRGAGIGAIQKDKKAAERFKDKGNELAESNFQEMTKQMENFRQNLEEFAREHREDIKKNPKFRKHFQVGYDESKNETIKRNIIYNLSCQFFTYQKFAMHSFKCCKSD